MIEHRCRNADCRALLFRAHVATTGRIETVCPNRRCRRAQTLVLTGERCASVPAGREEERRAS